MGIEVFNCESSTPQSLERTNIHYRSAGVHIIPCLRMWDADRIDRVTTHDIISYNGVKTDGDLVFSIAWNEGFYIHRLEDDGTLTELFHELQPLSGNYYVSLAIHPTSKQVFVGHYSYDGIAIYDYTDPTAPVKTVLNEGNSQLPFDRIGEAYGSSMDIAGDWLYMSANEKEHTYAARMHVTTQNVEQIPVSNTIYKNFRRNYVQYDPHHDQIFYTSSHSYDTDMYVVKNASSANPTCYALNMGGSGVGWRGRGLGVVVDPTNENIFWTAGMNHRIWKMDMSDIINSVGTTMTHISVNMGAFSGYPWNHAGYGRICEHPERPGMILILADRGGTMGMGWVDQDIGQMVQANRFDSYNGGKSPDGLFLTDYMAVPMKGTSNNGTEYIVIGTHGWDWGLSTVPANAGMFDMVASDCWVEYGTLQTPLSANISHCKVEGMKKDIDYFEPAGTSITFTVSNDNGATWESYDPNSTTLHKFSSVGNQLKFRMFFNKQVDKSPYVYAHSGIQIVALTKNFEPERKTRRAFRRMRRGA